AYLERPSEDAAADDFTSASLLQRSRRPAASGGSPLLRAARPRPSTGEAERADGYRRLAPNAGRGGRRHDCDALHTATIDRRRRGFARAPRPRWAPHSEYGQ